MPALHQLENSGGAGLRARRGKEQLMKKPNKITLL